MTKLPNRFDDLDDPRARHDIPVIACCTLLCGGLPGADLQGCGHSKTGTPAVNLS